MIAPFKPRIHPVHLEYQDPLTPYHSDFKDIYFAAQNGVEESTYVYLEGSGFIRALSEGKEKITIGEIGFGVGLNFILTAKHFLAHAKPGQKLFYVSAENNPVFAEDLEELYSRFPELSATAGLLLKNYPLLTPGFHSIAIAGGRITLLLLLGDALEMLSRLDAKIDFWYWDGFAPSKNPEAFSEPLFKQVARLSRTGTRGASFTAAGWVRRGLEATGFKLTKREGFGQKRECIVGEKTADESRDPHPAWFSSRGLLTVSEKDTIAVLGAGYAGTGIASALARRGFDVTLIDAFGISPRASGNPTGIFTVQMSRIPSPLSRFSQLSVTHLLRELKDLSVPTRFGILRQDEISDEAYLHSEYPPSFYEVRKDGVFLPQCGILSPPQFCKSRIEHSKIRIVQEKIQRVEKTLSSVKLFSEDGRLIVEAAHVVYTLGADLFQLPNPLRHPLLEAIPYKAIRGQILRIRPTEKSRSLEFPMVQDGYVTQLVPEISGNDDHVLGATYQPTTVLPNQEEVDTEKLLSEAPKKWPVFEGISKENVTASIVGYRLAANDTLPVIGPLCEEGWMRTHYEKVLKGGRPRELPPLQASAREWVFMGLGSRGIPFSSIGAEILASVMCDEPLAIEADIWEHLHPGRFIVRQLRKN